MIFTRFEIQIQKVLQRRERSQVVNARRRQAEATQMLSGKKELQE